MTTITLRYDAKSKGFRVGRTGLFVPAPRDEGEAVADYLGMVQRDNPSIQYAMGIVGARSVRFKIQLGREG